MWRYDSIQFREFNPIILMWTQHINVEKYIFQQKKNMATEEDILVVIYINLINMVNALTGHLPTFK